MIYEPQEDSLLIKKHIKNHAKGIVLDVGTGSGILAQEAAKTAKKVIAVDINKEAINCCKKNIKNVEFRVSNLFENVKEVFDLIIFNPPYLAEEPNEDKETSLPLSGGKQGFELIKEFLSQVNPHLNPNGKILLIFSSLTNKAKIDEIIKLNNFKSKLLEKKHIFFEDLYLYLLSKL